MFAIKLKGLQPSLPLDVSTLSGDLATDLQNAYVISLKAGALIKLGANGVAIATGAAGEVAIGFCINDAVPAVGDNPATLASQKVAACTGDCVVSTDYAVDAVIAAGAKLYAGAAGQLTSTESTSTQIVGIAITARSANVPVFDVLSLM